MQADRDDLWHVFPTLSCGAETPCLGWIYIWVGRVAFHQAAQPLSDPYGNTPLDARRCQKRRLAGQTWLRRVRENWRGERGEGFKPWPRCDMLRIEAIPVMTERQVECRQPADSPIRQNLPRRARRCQTPSFFFLFSTAPPPFSGADRRQAGNPRGLSFAGTTKEARMSLFVVSPPSRQPPLRWACHGLPRTDPWPWSRFHKQATTRASNLAPMVGWQAVYLCPWWLRPLSAGVQVSETTTPLPVSVTAAGGAEGVKGSRNSVAHFPRQTKKFLLGGLFCLIKQPSLPPAVRPHAARQTLQLTCLDDFGWQASARVDRAATPEESGGNRIDGFLGLITTTPYTTASAVCQAACAGIRLSVVRSPDLSLTGG